MSAGQQQPKRQKSNSTSSDSTSKNSQSVASVSATSAASSVPVLELNDTDLHQLLFEFSQPQYSRKRSANQAADTTEKGGISRGGRDGLDANANPPRPTPVQPGVSAGVCVDGQHCDGNANNVDQIYTKMMAEANEQVRKTDEEYEKMEQEVFSRSPGRSICKSSSYEGSERPKSLPPGAAGDSMINKSSSQSECGAVNYQSSDWSQTLPYQHHQRQSSAGAEVSTKSKLYGLSGGKQNVPVDQTVKTLAFYVNKNEEVRPFFEKMQSSEGRTLTVKEDIVKREDGSAPNKHQQECRLDMGADEFPYMDEGDREDMEPADWRTVGIPNPSGQSPDGTNEANSRAAALELGQSLSQQDPAIVRVSQQGHGYPNLVRVMPQNQVVEMSSLPNSHESSPDSALMGDYRHGRVAAGHSPKTAAATNNDSKDKRSKSRRKKKDEAKGSYDLIPPHSGEPNFLSLNMMRAQDESMTDRYHRKMLQHVINQRDEDTEQKSGDVELKKQKRDKKRDAERGVKLSKKSEEIEGHRNFEDIDDMIEFIEGKRSGSSKNNSHSTTNSTNSKKRGGEERAANANRSSPPSMGYSLLSNQSETGSEDGEATLLASLVSAGDVMVPSSGDARSAARQTASDNGEAEADSSADEERLSDTETETEGSLSAMDTESTSPAVPATADATESAVEMKATEKEGEGRLDMSDPRLYDYSTDVVGEMPAATQSDDGGFVPVQPKRHKKLQQQQHNQRTELSYRRSFDNRTTGLPPHPLMASRGARMAPKRSQTPPARREQRSSLPPTPASGFHSNPAHAGPMSSAGAYQPRKGSAGVNSSDEYGNKNAPAQPRVRRNSGDFVPSSNLSDTTATGGAAIIDLSDSEFPLIPEIQQQFSPKAPSEPGDSRGGSMAGQNQWPIADRQGRDSDSESTHTEPCAPPAAQRPSYATMARKLQSPPTEQTSTAVHKQQQPPRNATSLHASRSSSPHSAASRDGARATALGARPIPVTRSVVATNTANASSPDLKYFSMESKDYPSLSVSAALPEAATASAADSQSQLAEALVSPILVRPPTADAADASVTPTAQPVQTWATVASRRPTAVVKPMASAQANSHVAARSVASANPAGSNPGANCEQSQQPPAPSSSLGAPLPPLSESSSHETLVASTSEERQGPPVAVVGPMGDAPAEQSPAGNNPSHPSNTADSETGKKETGHTAAHQNDSVDKQKQESIAIETRGGSSCVEFPSDVAFGSGRTAPCGIMFGDFEEEADESVDALGSQGEATLSGGSDDGDSQPPDPPHLSSACDPSSVAQGASAGEVMEHSLMIGGGKELVVLAPVTPSLIELPPRSRQHAEQVNALWKKWKRFVEDPDCGRYTRRTVDFANYRVILAYA